MIWHENEVFFTNFLFIIQGVSKLFVILLLEGDSTPSYWRRSVKTMIEKSASTLKSST